MARSATAWIIGAVSTPAEPVEHSDRWILSFRGLCVTKISVGDRLTLTLDSDWEVVLEAPAYLSAGSLSANERVELFPQTQDVAAALRLFGTEVLSAVAFKSGALRMVFSSGTHLNCPVSPSFEAWQITGPRGQMFVSMPGGDLAVWSGNSMT